MSALANTLSGNDLQSILARLQALLTPTEQLPGQSPVTALLAQPSPLPISSGAPAALQSQVARPASTSSVPASSGSSGGSSRGNSLSQYESLLKNLPSLFGTSLASYASGAPANAAVTQALGTVGSQTAPTSAAIQAANDAALGGSAAEAGLAAYGSGAAADAATTAALGSVGAQTAGEAAAIQAANDAALASSAAGSGAGAGAGAAGSGSSALGVAGALAIPAAIAALGFMGDEGDYGLKNIGSILGQVQAGTQGGYINPNGSVVDPASNAGWRAITALNQSQLGPGGSYGKYSGYATQGLNALGYQTLQQQAKALGINGAGLGGPGGMGYGVKVMRS